MLQSIRDKTHGWIAGIIVSILILSFALWGIHSYLEGSSDNTTVAKVNGTQITKGQLAVAYERLRRQLQIQYSSSYALPESAEATLKNRALQTLINIEVLKQASLKQGYRVSNEQVNSLLESMPDFQVNDRFSLARFQQVLSTTLFTPNDFLNLLQTSLLIDQPRLGLLFTSYPLPNEVNQAVLLVNQERSIQYATLSTESFLTKPINIPQDKIEAYYKAHQDEFKTPEQVSIDYIAISTDDLMKTLHPSEEELKNFYNENSNTFTTPPAWQLEAILIPVEANAPEQTVAAAQHKIQDIQNQIKQGASFASFAKQYPATKLKLEGFVSATQIPDELQKSMASLTKPGDMTPAPIRISTGFILLKATNVTAAKVEPYAAVKDKVKTAYTHQQAAEKLGDLKEKLANITYEHPESLQLAAQEMNLPIQSSVLFTKDKGGSDISSHNKIREAAFSPDVLISKNNSEVIQLSPDTALVLRVKTHVPAALLPLASVQKQITDKLKTNEASLLAQQEAATITQKLSSGATLSEVAAAYHVNWNNVGFLGRHSTKVDAAILDQAFAMPKPAANQLVYAFVKTPTGYAIVALSGVKDGVNTRDQADLFAEQIQNAQGILEYELYKESLMRHAKIVTENAS